VGPKANGEVDVDAAKRACGFPVAGNSDHATYTRPLKAPPTASIARNSLSSKAPEQDPGPEIATGPPKTTVGDVELDLFTPMYEQFEDASSSNEA
jgi:hypothetical protein